MSGENNDDNNNMNYNNDDDDSDIEKCHAFILIYIIYIF